MKYINLVFLVAFLFASNTSMLANNTLVDTTIVLEIIQAISTNADDAEERSNGTVALNSSDLELITDNNFGDQTIGFRFTNIAIDQGAEISEAYIQFTTDDEESSGFSDLVFSAEAVDDSAPFEENNFNITNRQLSNAQVDWLPGGWYNPGEASALQKTSDLTPLVQETVNRVGWQYGNSMSFIISGLGQRIAAAYDLNPDQAAKLIVKIAYEEADTLLQNVYINEVMPSNSLITDEYGETDDWIEIYNAGTTPLFLGGLYLTDDLDDLQKWQITSAPLIAPGGFGLIWADDETVQGGFHAPFKLKSSGEALALVQELNGTLHILDSLQFPAVPQNISYGRVEDGQDDWVFFGTASPGASNNGQQQSFAEEVLFSDLSGHYPTSILLEMSVTDPDVSIYYTLDGSVPTEQDFLYQNPVSIDETRLVQAKGFKPGFISVSTTSEFFIINEPSEIPVLNVQSNPSNFWDNQIGIYVAGTNGSVSYCNDNVRNWNQSWEKPCKLTYYEADGTNSFQVNAGMKIGGACSRNLKMKSLNFFLRSDDYGDELVDHQIFPNSEITEFRRMKIRNSGTDWIEMLFRDGMNSLVMENTVDLDLLDYRPVRVYLNGAYWGIYGLREMFNKHYVESHHGVDKDNIDLLGDPYGPGSQVREGDFERYDEMMNFVDNNALSVSSNYEEMREFIDIQEYLNYHITQIYFANYDQPGNNVRIWRDRDGGKFRWMLFDTDASTGWDSWGAQVGKATHNTLQHMLNDENIGGVPGFPQWPNGPESTYLFRKLIENEDFENELIQRMCTFRELIFAPQRVLPMVDSLENLLLPEMQRHITSWLGNNQFGVGTPSGGSVAQWQNIVDNYRSFFNNREFHIKFIFQNTLGLDGRYDLTFGYDQTTLGDVVIHENEMAIPYNYEGEYFQNIPIRLKAVPKPGYYFSHWLETGQTTAVINYVNSEDAIITPVFSDQPVATTEIDVNLNIKIYPNPAQEQIYIEISDLEDTASITFFDVLGKELLQTVVSREVSTLEISQLPSGICLVKIEKAEGAVTKRIFIQ